MQKYPIVILPGWLLGSKRYLPLAAVLRKEGYKTYIVDFPGFEQGVSLTRALNLTDYVKYLHKFLHAHKIDRSILLCHSFGGRVAIKFTSQEPKKVAALILSGTPGYPGISKVRYTVTLFIAKVGKLITWLPPFFLIKKQLRSFFYRLIKSNDYYRASSLINSYVKDTFQNIIKEQLIEYMGKIRTPTLLVWGEKDVLVPLKIAQRMKNLLVNSTLTVVAKRGHMFIYQNPEEFLTNIRSFISSL